MTVADGATTYDVACRIGPGLAKAAVGGRISANEPSRLVDLHASLPGDCELKIVTGSDDDDDALYLLRHSAAHVMAEAVCKLFPDTQLVYGPPVEDGFYYDIDLAGSITPDDFPRIEDEMRRIVAERRPFTRYETPRGEAMNKLRAEGNRYKVDNAERAEGDTLSFYVTGRPENGDFEDLCRGPHLPDTGRIGAFCIRQVSGSYYRGDVNEVQLQRVYGTAFYSKKSLKAYLQRMEEAKARDHRTLGRALGLFTISPEVGSGLVLWQPNGAIVRMELEKFLQSEMLQRGYQPVFTPHIGRLALFRRSGHYPYYEDSQFPALYETDRGKSLLSAVHVLQRSLSYAGEKREEVSASGRALVAAAERCWGPIEGAGADCAVEQVIDALQRELEHEDGYLLKPMNCPHHIHLYKSGLRSYRDLPVKLAEFGTVYRYEQSGELGGMIRVRGFTQDDAHLFCTPEQLEGQLLETVELTQMVLSALGLTDYRARIGLRDATSDKYVGDPENWARAERNIRNVVAAMDLEATEEIGEAAFYGPKIDFLVKDSIGRSWQLGTVQVDYNLPERFDLSYVGRDNTPHRPVMIHRAPFGSMERFIAILIEHFAGAFPLWLAPVQVGVATVSEKAEGYARAVYQALGDAGMRAELDIGSDKIGPKKHRLRAQQIPYILVIGELEAENGTINVNDRTGKTLGTYPLGNFLQACRMEIEHKGRETAAEPIGS